MANRNRNANKLTLDSANKRVDSVLADLQELKMSLKYSQKDIDELKEHQKAQESESKDISRQVNELKSGQVVMGYQEQICYLENQCRRNNLVINGLGPDKADETWAETESKVQELLTTKLKLNDTIEFERAHMNGKFSGNGEKPRSVVMKPLCFKDKQLILSRANYLKNTSIYINEDYSERVRREELNCCQQ